MGLAAQPQLSILSEMVQSFKAGQEAGQPKLRAIPTYILVASLGSRSLRMAHSGYSLYRNGNPALKDEQPLSSAVKAAHVYLLLDSAIALYIGGKELARRLDSPEVETKTEEARATELEDADKQAAEKIADVLAAVAIGLNILQAWQGKALLTQRDLSPYGRVFALANGVSPAIKLAYRLSH